MAKREHNGDDSWIEGIDCFSDEITCPHCLEIDFEHCEYPRSLNHDGDEAVTKCGECGKEFTVTLCVEYTFQTDKKVK
jgi:transcription elongation factor Elf1